MGLSYSTSAYAEPGSATAAVDVVARGTRGRLMSVWFLYDSAGTVRTTANALTLKTGGSSGSLIFSSNGYCQYGGNLFGEKANAPFSFVPNGILFTDGLNAQMTSSGMESITVTYIGEG